jgi:hypothetical protein
MRAPLAVPPVVLVCVAIGFSFAVATTARTIEGGFHGEPPVRSRRRK